MSKIYWDQLCEGSIHGYLVATSGGVREFATAEELLGAFGQDNVTVIRAAPTQSSAEIAGALRALHESDPRLLLLVPDSKAADQLKAVFREDRRDRATGGGSTPSIAL